MLRVLEVPRTTFTSWRSRGASARAVRDADLIEVIRQIYAEHRGAYGVRRMHQELDAQGFDVGRDQTARLMRTAGLHGITKPRRHKVVPLGDRVEATENIVDRNFDPATEDTGDSDVRVWCGDITQIATCKGGWAYVAIVMC